MGKHDSPPPPDYEAAAKAQGDANLQAGQQTAALNRPNQVGPDGTQTWSMREGADPKNPQAGDWTVTNALSPQQQALKDIQDSLSKQYGTMAQGALSTIGDTMAQKFDTSHLPQMQTLSNSGLPGLSSVTPTAGQFQSAPSVGNTGPLAGPAPRLQNAPGIVRNLANVSMPNDASRQAVTDAMYRRQTSMLDPQTQQQNSDLTSRLAAQGITPGSEAYQREMDNQSRQQREAYQSARDSAITAGGAEDSRINAENINNAGFNNSNLNTQFSQGMQSAEMNNDNAGNTFQRGLAALGYNRDSGQMMFDRGMQATSLNNQNLKDQFSQGVTAAGINNANHAQLFNENQAMAGANNTLHSNAVSEALMQRELGMNEANALRTGDQVGNPQFQPYGGGGQISAAPIYQATNDGYNAALAANNANNANTAGIFSGLTKIASAYAGRG